MKLVIDIEPRYCKNMHSDVKGLYYEAMDRIIEAVSNGIPYEERSQGDLINRETLKNHIIDIFDEEVKHDKTWAMGLKYSLKIIDNAPIVEPRIEYGTDGQPYRLFMSGGQVVPDMLQDWKYEERPQGEWIIVKDERYGDHVKCPFCGKELAGTDLNFCCKCGAKLIGSEKMNGDAE